jgi:hypothetical protein
MRVQIPPDENGFLGRECPNENCLGYFKVTPGTGITGPAPCHCPYCGHTAEQAHFWTAEQLEYAKSVALHHITEGLLEDLRAMQFEHPPRGTFGIGISLKVEGQPTPVRDYQERRLETEVICERCTLRYAIYGVFAFCPDCRVHNSLQILKKNLELYEKLLDIARPMEPIAAKHLTGNALEDAVAAFDGFGRETCRVRAAKASTPDKAESVSFQNLGGARRRIEDLFGIDIAAAVAADEWDFACRCFQKRHILSHRMGVVDEKYMQETADPAAVPGRMINIDTAEVLTLIGLLRHIGDYLLTHLPPG